MMEESDEHRKMLRIGNKEVVKSLSQLAKKKINLLRVEFFVYASNENNANNVAIELSKLKYKVWVDISAANKKEFVVTGWTIPMDLSNDAINIWTDSMCKLAEEHDSFFDGWGTSPDQTEEDFEGG